VSAVAAPERMGPPVAGAVAIEELGELTPIGRPGGQGRVYQPDHVPPALGASAVVVKLYRRPPAGDATKVLSGMVTWSRRLDPEQRSRLRELTGWPLALVCRGPQPAGILMHDLRGRFEVPFVMPSGRRQRVLLTLEHLLGSDHYLELRGLPVRLDTATRLRVAQAISQALAFLHRHGIAVGDIAPSNLLIALTPAGPRACFIDCDSMVFRGRRALPAVETADWQLPAGFREPSATRAADAYKLGLIVLRLLARSHDARALRPHLRHVPVELREPLARALGEEPARRPAAGEWQRALRELAADPELSSRYPEPAVQPPVAAAPPRRPPATPASAGSLAGLGRPPARRRGPQPLGLAWAALVAVVLWLLFAHLLAAAVPNRPNLSAAPSGGPAAGLQYYYYGPGPGGLGR